MAQGEKERAAQYARAATLLGPGQVETWITCARLLLEQRLLSQAEIAAQQATRVDTASGLAHAVLATVQQQRRDMPAALESSARGVELEPRNAGVHLVRVVVLHGAGRLDEARQQVELALTLPHNAAVDQQLKRLADKLGLER